MEMYKGIIVPIYGQENYERVIITYNTVNGDSGVRKQPQNRLPNIDTISQLDIISKATRCPQSYSFIIIHGI